MRNSLKALKVVRYHISDRNHRTAHVSGPSKILSLKWRRFVNLKTIMIKSREINSSVLNFNFERFSIKVLSIIVTNFFYPWRKNKAKFEFIYEIIMRSKWAWIWTSPWWLKFFAWFRTWFLKEGDIGGRNSTA